MKPVYYNDNDRYCAQWLRNLIAAGHLPAGEVDDRPIQSVSGSDLGRFGQCHFFAGIGGWALALRLAGWPDDRDVWTGSCPCQPFSAAGKRRGTADERHLWPEFARLIGECRPATVLGEQVASKDGRQWLAGVFADLEGMDYAVAGADLCAAGVGAPHIRQRLYWAADHDGATHASVQRSSPAYVHRNGAGVGTFAGSERGGAVGRMADTEHTERWPISVHRKDGRDRQDYGRQEAHSVTGACGEVCTVRLGDADDAGPQGRRGTKRCVQHEDGQTIPRSFSGRVVNTYSTTQERLGPECVPLEPEQETRRSGNAMPWADAIAIGCADGKTRRIEPSIFPLAHAGEWGTGSRVGLLRGAGNAIVPQVAAQFVAAVMECRP